MTSKILQKRGLLIFLAPILIGGAMSAFILETPKLYVLSRRGIQVEGVITRFEPDSNQTYYRFSYGGTSYDDSFLYHKGSNPGYPKEGDLWKVTVDPEAPPRHCLGDASTQFNDSLKGTAFIIIGVFVILLFRELPNPFSRFDKEAKDEWEKHKRDPWIK